MTHLALGLVALVHDRRQTKTYWVHLSWVVYTLFWLSQFWWFFFAWSALASWSLGMFRFFLLYALVLSVGAGLLFPIRMPVEDYKGFFYDNARWFFGLLLCVQGLDVFEVYKKAEVGIRAVPDIYLPFAAVTVLGFGIAMFTKSERYHGAFALLALLTTFGYETVVFALTL